MTPLAEFLERLFTTGEGQLGDLPEHDDSKEVQRVLQAAFEVHRLEVAGPRIEFDPFAAVAAANFTARACWFAMSNEEPPEEVKEILRPLAEPKTPAAHLSIDLTLRYAVTIYRRTHAHNAKDVLATQLADVLRRCPLTGVLADLGDPPTGDLTFAGHFGLELLYAERLASNARQSWLPAEGRLREVVEMVFRQSGKAWP